MASTIDLTGDDDLAGISLNPAQVNVKLRSLDGGLDRHIFLSEKVGLFSIDIGRASKNLDRDMYPQRKNAWIESPVMSRNHALLFIESRGNQAVYVKDMGSTHGTQLNGHPIVPKKKVPLASGDVLGFGGTVMAGTQTFKAKNFLVECQWERTRGSPIILTPSTSPGNTAPRTYSVPSLGDSEDEETEEEVDQRVLLFANDSSPQLSSSSALPVASEGAIKELGSVLERILDDHPADAVDDSSVHESSLMSDNESPEAVPFQKSNTTENETSFEIVGFQGRRNESEGSVADCEPVIAEHNCISENRDMEPPSPIYSPEMPRSPSYSPSSPVYSPQSPTMVHEDRATMNHSDKQCNFSKDATNSVCGYSEDDWFDREDAIDVYDDYDANTDVQGINEGDRSSSSSGESTSSSASDISGSDMPDETSAVDVPTNPEHGKDMQHQTCVGIRPLHMYAMAQTKDFATSTRSTIQAPRHPSPSDAALAKSCRAEQPDEVDESAKLRKPASIDESQDLGLESTSVPSQQPHDVLEKAFVDSMRPKQAEQRKRGYSQGPFTVADGVDQGYASQQSVLGYNLPLAFEEHSHQETMPYFGSDQLVDMEIGLGSNSSLFPFGPRKERSRFWREPYTLSPQVTNVSSNNVQAESRPSKLTISHLVNNDLHEAVGQLSEDGIACLKRKADEISNSDEYGSFNHQTPVTKASARPDTGAQRPTTIPNTAVSNTLNHERLSVDEHIQTSGSPMATEFPGNIFTNNRTRAPDLVPLVQHAETPPSLSASVGASGVSNYVDRGEPAPKRVKTLHRTGRTWVRKAATHVLAGVAGAAALLGVLIATVPEETQREAFSEY